MAPASITAIVAATVSNGIGLSGGLPWRLPGEIKYFAQVTTGQRPSEQVNAVIMGRKTWESIPPKFRPLKARRNLVVSRAGVQVSGQALTSAHKSLEDAIAACDKDVDRVFLIGGAQLYAQALESNPPLVDRVLLTRVKSEFKCDAFLYDFTKDSTQWRRASHDQLRDWAGWDVPAGDVEEKGVKYEYEMWVRQ